MALVAGATLAGPLTSSVAAQTPRSVRVISKAAPIRVAARPTSDVLMTALRCTVFEVMDKETNWYWIYLPRDTFGVRRPGYISALDVEITTDEPCKDLPTELAETAKKQAETGGAEPAAEAPPPSRSLIKAQNELEQARRQYEKVSGVPGASADAPPPAASDADKPEQPATRNSTASR
jgi:hypothetical protein